MLGRLKHLGAITEAHTALQSITEVLLRHGSRHRGLCRLPLAWLKYLLDKLASASQAFVLRRSAGFAYSFLSLLRAEPRNCPAVLLPATMDMLIAHAREGVRGVDSAMIGAHGVPSATSWRTCVHSLNILKLIVNDATLAADVIPYIVDCTRVCMMGFQDRNWAVRNSCMMVFTAVIQRAVDNQKNAAADVFSSSGLGGIQRSTTMHEFFARFPELYPFLREQLEIAVAAETKDGLHPSLYPLFLLISRMKARVWVDDLLEGGGEDEQPVFDVSVFIPLVHICSSQRFHKLRVVSSWALIPLIPVELAAEHCNSVLSSLAGCCRTNTVHGAMLQVNGLLESLAVHLTYGVTSADTLLSLSVRKIETLILPALLATEYSMDAVAPVYLDILYSLATLRPYLPASSISGEGLWEQVLRTLRRLAERFITKAIKGTVSVLAPCLLLKALRYCIGSWDLLSVGDDKTALRTMVDSCLSHSIVEVRAGCVEGVCELLGAPRCDITGAVAWPALTKNMSSGKGYRFSSAVLEPLLARISSETYPPVLSALLRLVCSVLGKLNSAPVTRALLSSWRALVDLSAPQYTVTDKANEVLILPGSQTPTLNQQFTVQDTDVSRGALTLFGFVIHAWLAFHTKQQEEDQLLYGYLGDALGVWCALVKDASSAQHPLSTREAATNSLATSNVLCTEESTMEDADALVSSYKSHVWLIAVQLLQDDDQGVRALAADHVASALGGPKQGFSMAPSVLLRAVHCPLSSCVQRALCAGHASGFIALKQLILECCNIPLIPQCEARTTAHAARKVRARHAAS
jgi:hypothetical protein